MIHGMEYTQIGNKLHGDVWFFLIVIVENGSWKIAAKETLLRHMR